MQPLFRIARISAAHGIRGEVKLVCFLQNPGDITGYNPLTTAKGAAYNISITGTLKDALIARLEGINDRNAAESLRGVELYGDAAKLPATKNNEYYVDALIGLDAVLADGTKVGTVTGIENYGAGDIIAIDRQGEELLLPFKEPFVGEISTKRIIITLPEYMGEEHSG